MQGILSKIEELKKSGVEINLDLSDSLSKFVSILELFDSIQKGAASTEMSELVKFLKENPQLAEGILSQMFNLLSNCEKSMQPDEYKNYLKKMAMLFHPDKLKNLRNIPQKDAEKIYQLTTELMDTI